MESENKSDGSRQCAIKINRNNLSVASEVPQNITEGPKPKHVTDDMPYTIMIKHVSDERPWFFYKLMQAGRQGKVGINVISKIYISSWLLVTEIIKYFYKGEQDKNYQVNGNQHH